MMTREDLLKWWDEIVAFKNGAQIQFFDGGEWLDTVEPCFDATTKYRIKPEKKIDTVMKKIDNRFAGSLYYQDWLDVVGDAIKDVYGDE